MIAFQKYLYWAVLGLFAYMPFHIFLSQWLSTYTGGLEAWKIAKDVFTAILVSAMVLTVLLTKKYTRMYLGLVAFAAAYLALHLVLLVATNQPTDTGLLATVYNNRIVWYLLIGYSLALLAPKLVDRGVFVKVLLAVSTVVCLIGLAQWVLPKDIMTNFGYSIERGTKPNFFIDDKPDLPRVFSTIRDPNSLGAFLILPITILAAALVQYWRTPRRMLLSGLLLLHLLILFLTFSRSALIGVVLAIGSLLVLRYGHLLRRHAKKLAVPAMVAALILIGGVFLLRDQYIVQNVVFHSDESTTLDDPNELRVQLFQKGVNGVVDDPEGHGPGMAGLVSTRLPNGLLTENYYLQIAYEVGIVGLLMFIGLIVVTLRQLWKQRQSALVQALLASFVGLAFMNFLLHAWANEAVAVTWWLLAGLALARRTSEQSPVRATKLPQPVGVRR